jgi:ABC-type Fe3+/spermidine/putrescine transport system ATPase subunit
MISLQKVSVIYEEKTVLKEINLQIPKKERLVILGASGSGKSTLLRVIAGFIAPMRGEVLIEGKVVSKDGQIIVPPHQRDVAMVFQDLALWSHMNVYENIAFGLKIKKVPSKERKVKVTQMLSLVGLSGHENKRIDQLSGGEQQRVALARALILSPKIVLMDEPLSSLDQALNQRLRKEIVRLQEKFGFTLVYVTHNEEEAREIGTGIFYMSSGKEGEEGRLSPS